MPIGACALIRTNMVFLKLFFNGQDNADSFLNGLYARALKFHVIRMPCEKIVDMYIFLSLLNYAPLIFIILCASLQDIYKHKKEEKKKIVCFFELMLNVPVNSFGHVEMLPPF